MAFANETRTTTVVTDASQSVSELGKLELKYAEINQRLKDLKGRTKAVRDEKKALKTEAAALSAKIDDERQKVGVLGMSYNQLNRGLSQTRREMTALVPTMKNYEAEMARLTKQEKEYQKELKNRQQAMQGPKDQGGGGFFGSMKDRMGGGIGSAAVAGAVAGAAVAIGTQALAAVKQGLMEAFDRAREKSKALSGMAAITGLDLQKDAKDLRYYGDAAEYLGKKFNMAVPDVIAGFAKVGSIKPELLGAKEALVSLTEEAITLSRADGILSVEGATISLVGSLNQFNKGADQSTRFMNVLAASAKAGSAEINQVSDSFKVAGAVLSASNISFEQSNALVQTLAKKQILGSEAGTALRNVFSKLMVQNKELNPSIVGLNTALENLSKLTPQKMVKLFGQENLVAAMTLVEFRKEVKGLAADMTGTTEATDQARKRMDNLDEDIASLGKSWDGLFSLNPAQESGFRSVVKWLTNIFDYVSQIKTVWNSGIEGSKPFGDRIFEAYERTQEIKRKQEQYNREMEARNKGKADYLAGTTEDNLNKYEGKTTFDKEAAYARDFVNQARIEYKKLDAQIAYIKKAGLDGKNYDVGKMREELARLAGRIVAGKNATVDIEQRRKANEDFKRKIAEGEAEEEKKKDEKDAEKRKRHLELLAKQELDNQNRIAEIRTRALVDEEERDVQLRQLKYAKELQEIAKQEGDKTELYKALEEELQQDIAEIRKKYAEKYEKERIETASRLADAIRAIEMQQAQIRVQRAESKQNNNPEIFNARRNLSFTQEAQDLERLTESHQKEQEKYKDNAAALFNIEIAYQKQVFAIRQRGRNERLALQEEEGKQEQAAAKENTRQKLDFDVTQAEWSGSPRKLLDAKLAVLKFQMDQEIEMHGDTEEKKAEITRRYIALMDHERKMSRTAEISQYLDYFQAGLQQIAQLSAVNNRNEETKSNDAHERETRQLDDRLKKGLISQEQYSAQKEKIDAQYEEKQRQIRRKQAIAEKKAALFEAAIAIPLNILKAGPNPFAIALALVTGAAQLAAISAQEIPEFAVGGRVKGQWGQGIIARIGEKGEEQITPAWQMADPAARPYLNWLEERRRSGTSGGNGAPPPGTGGVVPFPPEVAQTLQAVNAALSRLNEAIPNIRATLRTDDLDDYLNDTAMIKQDAMGK